MVLSITTFSKAADFATDEDSILQQLSMPASNTEKKSANVSKGFVMPGSPERSKKIRVLQESNIGDSLTRNFAVIERQENVPRVNLRIEFDFNSARLRANSFPLLQSLAQALRSQELASASILVNGHTDSTGREQYNLDLSFRRAQTVREYLVSAVGISRNRLTVQGFGEGAPLVSNDTAANRQLNRRVEIERVP